MLAQRETLDRVAAFLKKCGATEVYVFGSYARGEARPDSDLDLAVRGIPGTAYYGVLGQLYGMFDIPIDLVLLDSENSFALHLQKKIDRGWAIRVG